MVKVKICGITNLEDAQNAVLFGADAIGFIFTESPRKVKPEIVKNIVRSLDGDILKVGVFVNETIDNVKKTVEMCSLDVVQLHGEEDPSYCSNLRNWQVIKAFRIKDDLTLKPIMSYKNVFAYLLDTFAEGKYGGSGKVFDWNLAVKAKSFGKPIIVSGGLNIGNIEEAIKVIRPYGVDISSSIEIRPGKKDAGLMKQIISKVKTLDYM